MEQDLSEMLAMWADKPLTEQPNEILIVMIGNLGLQLAQERQRNQALAMALLA